MHDAATHAARYAHNDCFNHGILLVPVQSSRFKVQSLLTLNFELRTVNY